MTLPRCAAFAVLLSACAPHPIVGKWVGDDLPLQLTTDLEVSVRAEANFSNIVSISAKVRTANDIELASIELRGAYAINSRTEPERLTIEIDSIVVKTIAGQAVAIDERNQVAGGTLLCFPLGDVDACIPRDQTVDFAVDRDTLRLFFAGDDGGVRLAITFSRVK